jgi:hypothetical protein
MNGKKCSFCWFLLHMSELTFKSIAVSVCTATFNAGNHTFLHSVFMCFYEPHSKRLFFTCLAFSGLSCDLQVACLLNIKTER